MNIWVALSGAILSIVEFALSLLPNADLTFVSTIDTQVSKISEFIGGIDWIIPAADLIAVLTIIIGIEFAILTYKIVNKIIGIISLSHIKI